MNMEKVGLNISTLRKKRDMTQVDLADRLGVTYQAVSSWERGNTMPDISKILEVSIDELLGNAKAAQLVSNILSGNEANVDAETLSEVATILKPSQLGTLAGQIALNPDTITHLAPFLDSETLAELVLKCDNMTALHIVAIAPFMDNETTSTLAKSCQSIEGFALTALAPFLNRETLNALALHCGNIDADDLVALAPFISPDVLKELTSR